MKKEYSIWQEWQTIASDTIDVSDPRRIDFYSDFSQMIEEHKKGLDIQEPKSAIIIPALNEQDSLPRALAGINLALSSVDPRINPIEVIVVDNGSTDLTADIAKQFSTTLVSEPRRGIANARQSGLESTSFSVDNILVTDSDSIVSPLWISAHLRALLTQNYDYAYGPIDYVGDVPNIKDNSMLGMYSTLANVIHLYLNLIKTWTSVGQNHSYSKDAALAIGGYDRTLKRGADTLLMTKIAEQGSIARVGDARVLSSGRRILNDGIIKHGFWRLGNNLNNLFCGEVSTSQTYLNNRVSFVNNTVEVEE